MYTLVEIKGKQYKAEKGSLLKVDKIEKNKGEELEFDSVLLVSDQDKIKIGKPYVKGVKVKAIVVDHIKDKKIIIFKYKKRKSYRRKQGHRQQFTLIRVKEISGGSPEKPAAKSVEEAVSAAAGLKKGKQPEAVSATVKGGLSKTGSTTVKGGRPKTGNTTVKGGRPKTDSATVKGKQPKTGSRSVKKKQPKVSSTATKGNRPKGE